MRGNAASATEGATERRRSAAWGGSAVFWVNRKTTRGALGAATSGRSSRWRDHAVIHRHGALRGRDRGIAAGVALGGASRSGSTRLRDHAVVQHHADARALHHRLSPHADQGRRGAAATRRGGSPRARGLGPTIPCKADAAGCNRLSSQIPPDVCQVVPAGRGLPVAQTDPDVIATNKPREPSAAARNVHRREVGRGWFYLTEQARQLRVVERLFL